MLKTIYFLLIILFVSVLASMKNDLNRNRNNSNEDVSMLLKYNRKQIFWMHIQKTSSWISNLLLVWACPEYCKSNLISRNVNLSLYKGPLYQKSPLLSDFDYLVHIDRSFEKQGNVHRFNWEKKSQLMNCTVEFKTYGGGLGLHRPYSKQEMNHTIVTLFRNPITRILSQFLFDTMLPLGFILPQNTTEREIKARILSSENPFFTYASYPGIPSCQTKMMLGINCGTDYKLTSDNITEAIRRLDDLYFFGLTEEPIASANLFLKMHGGVNDVTSLTDPPFKFTLTRENRKHSELTRKRMTSDLIRNGWRDIFDEKLYLAASSIFYKRCAYYKIVSKYQQPEDTF